MSGRSGERATLRHQVEPGDPEAVRDITRATGFFRADEVDVAVELVEERITRGEASGYFFIFAEASGRIAGYACYGHIACTLSSYDLYWIAVHPDFQAQGLGKLLLREAERTIAAAGGKRVYIETSSRGEYVATRGFYEGRGYTTEAILKDFYAPGDGKIIFSKSLA